MIPTKVVRIESQGRRERLSKSKKQFGIIRNCFENGSDFAGSNCANYGCSSRSNRISEKSHLLSCCNLSEYNR